MLDRVYWAIEGRVVAHELSGEVTLQDVKDLIDQMRVMIDRDIQGSYVDVFLDVTRVTGYHHDVMNIKKLFASVKKHERVRWDIIINPRPNPVFNFVVRTVCQLFKQRLRIVPSMEHSLPNLIISS